MDYQLISPRDASMTALEQVLRNRGINDPYGYLNTDVTNVYAPTLLDNIAEGAKMLVKHISQGSKVMVQIDSDCDGYTSAALLINYINKLFPHFAQSNISYRPHTGKQHGLILDTIPDDVKLVIAPDSSSEDYEVHQVLKEKGVDVLVIDHHEADHASEYACVINNQLCDYPTKSLSGVAMVYKFCCYLDSIMGTDYAQDFIDLVALGLVADMMDLRDFETRYLVDTGLNNIRNPYFKGMVAKNAFSIGGAVTPFGVSFYIAPYINAVTRSGDMEEKVVLFEAMLDFRAYEQIPSTKRGCKGELESRVEQACRNCVNIKNRQTRTRDASLEIIEQIIEDQNLLANKIVAVRLNEAQKTTLSGLIANELMSDYKKPILILSETKHDVLDDDGNVVDVEIWWEGSFRGPNVPQLESVKDFFAGLPEVEYTAGHANAGGVGVKDKNFDSFIASANAALKDVEFTPSYKVDFIYDARIGGFKNDFESLADYKHIWGQEVEAPKIIIENINVNKDNLALMKGTTMKIIPSGQPEIDLIKFKVSEQEYETLYSEAGCVTITVLGVCERNTYNNRPQLIIKDYVITNRCDYYF